MQKLKFQFSSTQWFILLWLVGFLGLFIIASLFKLLLFFAYN